MIHFIRIMLEKSLNFEGKCGIKMSACLHSINTYSLFSIFFPNLLTRKARKFSLNEMSQQRCVLLDGIGHTYTKNYFVNHTALQFDEHNYRCPLEFRGNMHPNHQL